MEKRSLERRFFEMEACLSRGEFAKRSRAITRVWFNGRTSAFQADDVGSIPITRSRLSRPPESNGLGFLDTHDDLNELERKLLELADFDSAGSNFAR